MSKAVYCAALVLVGLLVVYHETLGFVASPGSLVVPAHATLSSVNRPAAPATAEAAQVGVATGVYGLALLATAAAGVLARAKRSKVMVHNYGGFKPVVGDRYQYTNDCGYLADGTPISTAGNNSLRTSYDPPVAPPAPPVAVAAPVAPVAPVAPAPVAPPTPVAAPIPATGGDALYGIKFDYCKQKDAYADLEFLNDVGYLPDGTPMNMAGNCINHPERIQPDPHTPGSPLPRANLHNSVGYLPDGTAMNAAGNALNHPERMQPDMHVAGSPLPKSVYYADVGYFADGTDLQAAGNNFKAASPVAFPTPAAPPTPVVTSTPVAASFVGSTGDALYGIKFDYCKQKDAYADLEFLNDVGYLPDGTPMNMAGNCINHPERIQPDPHTPGSPLPRANLHNSVGYLPDGTAMNAAGNALNHPERMQPDMHVAGSPLPKSVYYADVGYFADGTDLQAAGNNFAKVPAVAATTAPKSPAAAAAFAGTSVPKPTFRQPGGFAYSVQKDVYADFLFSNDVGYLPDGTPMNKAGNAMNHPERIQADPHTNGSPLPRANFANDVGYLPDGTPMNRAGNALNHPERLAADAHAPGSSLPASQYAADVGYLVDGTPLDGAGNNAVH